MSEVEINVKALRTKFASAKMSGVVSLIDMFVESKRRNKEITEIGSSSLGDKIYVSMAFIYKSMAVKFPDQPFSFFYIGRPVSRDGKRPALTWVEHLDMLRQVLEEIPAEPRLDFDLFCGTFAESQKRMNRLSVRIPNAIRQGIINFRRKFGLRISDDLLLGVRGWWIPKRRRKRVDVRDFVKNL